MVRRSRNPVAATQGKKKSAVSSSQKDSLSSFQPDTSTSLEKKIFPAGRTVLVIECLILIALLLGITMQNNWFPPSKSLKTAKAMTQNTGHKSNVVPASPPPVKHVLAASLSRSGRSVNVPILMYHYIGNNPNPADKARYILETTPDMLNQEMNYLSQNGFTPISLDTLYAGLEGKASLPPKPIVLTFDDGYVDFFVNAFPILKKYHFHATSFIPTSLMNQGFYLTWAEIKQMQQSGLISFEAHSLTHPNLVTISPERAYQEIYESKKVLESEIGAVVNFFAYPYGASNPLVQGYIKEAGYTAALGTRYGGTESEGNIYNWPRMRINGEITLGQFEKEVSP